MTVRNQKIAVFGGLAIIVIGLILLTIFYKEPFTPTPKFADAYAKAAKVSEEISLLTSNTITAIEDIELSDANGDAEKAKSFIASARAANQDAYRKAFELSTNLRQMAESLVDIDSRKVQQKAYEAVAIELSLVSEFINYTQYMSSFLDGLEQAVKTDNFTDRKTVDQLEREINKKVKVINGLNEDFKDKMESLLPKN